MPRFPRFALIACWLVVGWALAPHAWATWSIVVVNRKTGEVGITSATCIENLDLGQYLPVVVVGKGAAAAQSFIDTQANNRKQIWLALEAGYPPERILHMLGGTDSSHQTRQYGIVSRVGPPVTFTGVGAGLARFGVVGSIGDYDYAIQGNVLTGNEVVLAAETAFRNTPGDMAARMIEAMEAARVLGGDGRCSCSPTIPTLCGVPPANFTHSAYIGFFIVARPGDTDGDCTGAAGCATGDYYVNLNVQGNASTLDPVLVLRQEYDAWRAGLAGIPDHFQSAIDLPRDALIADGTDQISALVTLRDVEGIPIASGAASLEVERTAGGAITQPPTITDLGSGQFQVDWTASTQTGRAGFEVRAVLPNGDRIPLRPEVRFVSRAPAPLSLGLAHYRTGQGPSLPLRLHLPAAPQCTYRVLASLSGTAPGTTYMGQVVPLNADPFFEWTRTASGAAPFSGSVGVLDAQGRASATLALPSNRLWPFVGRTLSFSAAVQCSSGWTVTPPASLLIEW